MSTDNSPSQDSKPALYVTLPNFPEIIVMARRWDREPGFVRFEYWGFARDLVAAGVMTRAMAIPSGKHPRDPDGGRVHITRYWRLKKDGRSHRYCQILRKKAFAELARWPGVVEALAAHERFWAWDKEQRPWAYDARENARKAAVVLGLPSPAISPPRPRPTLRLVGDNTREPRP